jgi:hypothetical protein
MDEAALREIPKLEKRTGYLAMLGNVATLVGLLGTIIGLINSFAGVAGVDPSMKATLLAKGISEAMNCTAFGLITAVPALPRSRCSTADQTILDDINEVSVQVVNMVVGHRNAMSCVTWAARRTRYKKAAKAARRFFESGPFIDLLSLHLVPSDYGRVDAAGPWTCSRRTELGGASDEAAERRAANLVHRDGYTFASRWVRTLRSRMGEEYDYVKLADILKDAKTAYPTRTTSW